MRRAGKRVGVLAIDPSSPVLGRRPPRRPGADGRPCARPRGLHPLDGRPRAPRRPGVVDPAGGARPRRGRVRRGDRGDGRRRAERGRGRGPRRHHARAARARDGRRHPGREGGDPGDRRRVRRQQGRPGRRRPHAARARGPCSTMAERREGAWRPPVLKTVASTGQGIDELLAEVDRHAAWLEESGELARRRTVRARREVEAIALAALRERWGRADAGPTSTRSPSAWRRARWTPTPRPTSCWPTGGRSARPSPTTPGGCRRRAGASTPPAPARSRPGRSR